MSNTASIYTTLTFNSVVFGVLIVAFEFLRTREVDIYAPRTRGKHPTAPKPDKGLFGWFQQVYDICDDEMLMLAGLDGYVLLRFLRFCTTLCTVCSFGAAVLMPVYYYSNGKDDVYGVDKLSMANIDANGYRLWGSLVFCYLFTAIFLYLIHKEYEAFMHARHKFFLGCDEDIPAQMNFSIQVENIPPEFRTARKLKRFFENIFPNEVLYATVEVAMPELDQAVERRNGLVTQVEDAVAEYEVSHRQSRPQLQLYGGKPTAAYAAVCQNEATASVDKIEYLNDQLAVMCAEVGKLQARAIAATEEEEESELDSVKEGAPLRFSTLEETKLPGVSSKKGSKYDGSFSTTSTIPSASGLVAASPKHISGKHQGDNARSQTQPQTQTQTSTAALGGNGAAVDNTDQARKEADSAPQKSGLLAGPELLLKFGKQTSAMGLKAATEMSSKVGEIVSELKDNITSNLASATGFVTFKTRRAQVSAAQVPIISQKYPRVTATAAPAPSDIIWGNMSVSPEHTENMAYATSMMYYGGLLCWSAILAFVAALSEISTLQHYAPWLRMGDLTKAILQGLLPVLVMILFSMLLHWFMDYVARTVEKRKTQSAVQMEIFKWYFMYLIANVYLLLLAGSIFDSLEEAIDDPESIVTLISSALPSVSTFFINFIITTWLGGIPLILLQAGPSATLALYRMFVPPDRMTRRMLKSGPFAPYEVEHGTVLPDNLYVLCIVLLYWVISPVILLFASAFFFSSYMAYKYQYVFVNVRSFESGGQFFYGVYAYSMTGLLTGTVLFMAYMGVKQGVLQAPLLAPLPFIILYCWRYTEKQFKLLSVNMPFDTAVRVDDQVSTTNAHDTHEKLLASFTEEFLKQPNIVGPAVVYPYPHRILHVPLLNPHGALNDVYVEDIPEGMDPAVYIQQLQVVSRYEGPRIRSRAGSEVAVGPSSDAVGAADGTGVTRSALHSVV